MAQEVQPFFPDWIGTTSDGSMTLNISGFEALTVEALRDLRVEKKEEVDALREENRKLKDSLLKLETRMHAIEAKMGK